MPTNVGNDLENAIFILLARMQSKATSLEINTEVSKIK